MAEILGLADEFLHRLLANPQASPQVILDIMVFEVYNGFGSEIAEAFSTAMAHPAKNKRPAA